jgi:hypothetical protein
VAIAAQSALAFPPTVYALVPDAWSNADHGVVPEFDIEVWNDASGNLTAAELFGAALHPGVIADDDFTADHTVEEFTATSHGLLTGDGPIRLTNSGGALPAGLATATDYYVIRTGANTFKLASSFANALAGTVVAITGNGTGTHTLVDTASTMRVHWHSLGKLGQAEDGAVTLTSRQAYATRAKHRPRVFAYGIIATIAAGNIAFAVYPVVER